MENSALTLSELNEQVRECIEMYMPGTFWVVAEIFDIKVNATGHCYLEFVEKDPLTNRLIAKSSGIIWAQRYRLLKSYFEEETSQVFTSGLKIMINVSINFHALYGYSLIVNDIDPSYTLGDMARRKNEVIRQLREDGIFDLNKEFYIPLLPKRIAVISSRTAAGYDDFCTHLKEDSNGFDYTIRLFPAIMQGEQTEQSIISALDMIYNEIDSFDLVVIIRGGGASSDLSDFNAYDLCSNCAQFPLPIISGIGHERDETVLDMVAHTRVKTPTAAAEFILDHFLIQKEKISQLQVKLILSTKEIQRKSSERLLYIQKQLPQLARFYMEKQNNRFGFNYQKLKKENQIIRIRGEQKIDYLQNRLPRLAKQALADQYKKQDNLVKELRQAVKLLTAKETYKNELAEEKLRMLSPEQLLKRGYTLTYHNGKIVKEAGILKKGDTITTHFHNGDVSSIVK